LKFLRFLRKKKTIRNKENKFLPHNQYLPGESSFHSLLPERNYFISDQAPKNYMKTKFIWGGAAATS
jgi:hypothetical protein